MRIVLEKYDEDMSVKDRMEFHITEFRYTNILIGINIVDIGWRSIMKDQFDSFTITEE